jgi:[ribosomal protein S5]-alanine N-acetyltransferase
MSDTLFQTERLRIRPWTLSNADVAQAFAMYSDPEVARFIRDAPEESLETQRATLERVLGRFADAPQGIGWWAVELKETGRVIGTVSVKPLPGHDSTEIGYHLARPYWGKGYATEAARGAILYAFRSLTIDQICIVVNPLNERSLAVGRRLGMQPAGRITAYDEEVEMFTLPRDAALRV